METKGQLLRIKITDIVNSPYQGRLFDIKDTLTEEDEAKISELAQSIEQNGLLQAIVVRLLENGKYELVDGHRRVISYRRLGFGQIKAIVKELTDKQAQVFSIIGNLQRKNLNNIEQAIAYEKIIKTGLYADKRELSRAVGKDETHVGDLLNMLKMDKRVIDDLVRTNSVTDVRIMRMIRRAALQNEHGVSDEQLELYNITRLNKLSRKELADLIKERKATNSSDEDDNNEHITYATCDMKKRSANIKINLSKIDNKKREQIKILIEEQIKQLNEKIANSLGSK